ncbi:SCO family protein [Actibacterium sp. 188UL27-1]|uniref:SCO family protein n=1 Tax=Actibacterium sp. 188UL27-1 TaxID=2786961 RepID=UPI00195E821C|nr:SCO family protein [Actibacterium sp. 188UL27-1]MBM7069146.1 SCO family protein [Actibacterium sp. 188UL27-1]
MMRAALIAAVIFSGPAFAQDEATPAEAPALAVVAQTPASPSGLPFPVKLGGAFSLTDQTGATRTEVDPNGNFQLLFFGYANCEAICSVALPLMAETTDQLRDAGIAVQPVMITIDPHRDTVETIGPGLAKHHADFVGLTGTEAELGDVYKLFAVEKTLVFEDLIAGPIYAHGSHIYLLDAEGVVLTLLPPILSQERIAEIVTGYAGN